MAEDPPIRRSVLAAALAIVAISALAWWLRPGEPEAQPPAAAPGDALVLSADAGVERRSAGGWTRARAGDALEVTDSIRAGEGSTAEIALGRRTRITLAERSEVTVRELTAAAQRVGLVRGRIGVDVRPDGTRVLRVEDPSGTVVARGVSGRFGVVASGGGLAIAAAAGRVTVESAGRAVEVPEGAETVAWRGTAPLPPRPIPREVVLRVARRIEERRASACLVLHVDVATELLVNGEQVEVPADGTVVVHLPARTKRREVAVALRHAGGAVERRTLPCWESEGDVSALEVKWNAR
ncbi:MAG TPA: FecR family protein [Anaeromyxobacter sp.]